MDSDVFLMASYFAATARLFEDVMAPGGAAIINADAPEARITSYNVCYTKLLRGLAHVDAAVASIAIQLQVPFAATLATAQSARLGYCRGSRRRHAERFDDR